MGTKYSKGIVYDDSKGSIDGPVSELEAAFGDRFALKGCGKYEEMRNGNKTESWNKDAMGYPLAIAQCNSAADVSRCVSYAAAHLSPAKIPIAVAGGRHSHRSMVSGSFVIDLSGMKRVTMNIAEMYVDAEGGALLGDVDAACEKHNVATTAGHVSSTGCGGLIIQGGHGFLERKFGLTVDNLLEVEMVVPDGRILVANTSQNEDLFWAIRGGGGNFGIVTRFRLRVHPFPKKVLAGSRIHVPLGLGWFVDRPAILKKWADFMVNAPSDVTGLIVLPVGGPVIEVLMHTGDPQEGREVLAQHRKENGFPIRDTIKEVSYHNDVQKWTPGDSGFSYNLGVMVDEVTEDFAREMAELCEKKNSPGSDIECAFIFVPMGGAVTKVDPKATAYFYRGAKFMLLMATQWKVPAPNNDPSQPIRYTSHADYLQNCEPRNRAIVWINKARALFDKYKMADYAVLAESGDIGHVERRNRVVYGENFERLREIKRKYDPHNLFHLNDNIEP